MIVSVKNIRLEWSKNVLFHSLKCARNFSASRNKFFLEIPRQTWVDSSSRSQHEHAWIVSRDPRTNQVKSFSRSIMSNKGFLNPNQIESSLEIPNMNRLDSSSKFQHRHEWILPLGSLYEQEWILSWNFARTRTDLPWNPIMSTTMSTSPLKIPPWRTSKSCLNSRHEQKHVLPHNWPLTRMDSSSKLCHKESGFSFRIPPRTSIDSTLES